MLLMGDRYNESGGHSVYLFSNLYGAGRLRARKIDGAGMDSPYGWNTGALCIDDDEVAEITVHGGQTISADVEVLKAVIWWYDSRHGDDGTLDDIDLYLKTTGGTKLRSSADLYDNKERVVYDVGGYAVKLQVVGYDVTADNTGCGTNSMKVYFAWYYEDTDRDDANGPGSEIDIY